MESRKKNLYMYCTYENGILAYNAEQMRWSQTKERGEVVKEIVVEVRASRNLNSSKLRNVKKKL